MSLPVIIVVLDDLLLTPNRKVERAALPTPDAVSMPLSRLFESPTVAGMALPITQTQAQQATPEDIERLLGEVDALSDVTRSQIAPLIFRQERRHER